MLTDGLVGDLRGFDGLFFKPFANGFGLFDGGLQFGSLCMLLAVSTICCIHKFSLSRFTLALPAGLSNRSFCGDCDGAAGGNAFPVAASTP